MEASQRSAKGGVLSGASDANGGGDQEEKEKNRDKNKEEDKEEEDKEEEEDNQGPRILTFQSRAGIRGCHPPAFLRRSQTGLPRGSRPTKLLVVLFCPLPLHEGWPELFYETWSRLNRIQSFLRRTVRPPQSKFWFEKLWEPTIATA